LDAGARANNKANRIGEGGKGQGEFHPVFTESL
jgi:hypothetical protein